MIDSLDMISPSLLLKSDILRDELERLSDPNKLNDGNVLGLLKASPSKDEEEKRDNKKKFLKGLNLSQELADIRKRDISLNQKRASLFQIGDSSDEQDLSPLGGAEGTWGSRGSMFGGSGGSPSSPAGSEEMFSLQLDDVIIFV